MIMKKKLTVAIIIGMLVIAFVAVAFATTRDNKVNAGGDEITTTTTGAPTTEMPTEASTTEATTTPVETTTTETATTTVAPETTTTTEAPTTTMPVEQETTTMPVKEETTTAPVIEEETTTTPIETETTTETPTTTALIETTTEAPTTAPIETTTAKVEPETTTEAVKPLESWQKEAKAPSNTTEMTYKGEEDVAMFEVISKYDLPKGVYKYVQDICWDLANHSIEAWGYDPYAGAEGVIFDLSGNIIWELSVPENGFYSNAMLSYLPSEISADGTQFFDEYTGMWFDVPTIEMDLDEWSSYYDGRIGNAGRLEICNRDGVEVGQYYEDYALGFLGHQDCLAGYGYRVSETETIWFDRYSDMMAAYPDATWSGAMVDR